MNRIEPGDVLRMRELVTIRAERTYIPDPGSLVHLQFRRFAGCPICNLHLRSIAQRHDEIVAAGIREVVIFHAAAEDLLPYIGDLPFAVIADSRRKLYAEFGVESSLRSVLDPRAWGSALRGLFRKRAPLSTLLTGSPLGLPADFLISSDGRVLACKYGLHAHDQWSVDEILELRYD